MFRVRKATLEDVNAIYTLEKRVWGEEVTTVWDMATFIRHGEVLVAMERDLLVGALLSLISKNGDVYIVDVVVSEKKRRCGIAAGLYHKLFSVCPGRRVVTDVSARLVGAVALHEGLGFKKVKLEHNWYGLREKDEPRLLFQYEPK